ncbi:MAG TPA: hypothetical protein DCO89_01735 [Clostridiales bacterium]|nr:hypothetical protein [Clostridiales bacterium]
MKHMMLAVDLTLIFGVVIVVTAIIIGVILSVKLNRKVTNNAKKIDWNNFNAKDQLKKHVPMLWPKELEFYYMFRSVLPKEFMIMPKLGVDEIVKPAGGNLVLFNAVKEEHVDYCVVKVSTMEPIAVIDTYYPSISDSTMQKLETSVIKAFESVSIPVITYEILDIPYDKEKVLKKFLEAIDPVVLAQLRNKK